MVKNFSKTAGTDPFFGLSGASSYEDWFCGLGFGPRIIRHKLTRKAQPHQYKKFNAQHNESTLFGELDPLDSSQIPVTSGVKMWIHRRAVEIVTLLQ